MAGCSLSTFNRSSKDIHYRIYCLFLVYIPCVVYNLLQLLEPYPCDGSVVLPIKQDIKQIIELCF